MINCVAKWRRFEAMTQAELAAYCGCRRETIAKIERGNYNPSLELALKIALVLNRPVDTLFSIDDEEPPQFEWIRPGITREI